MPAIDNTPAGLLARMRAVRADLAPLAAAGDPTAAALVADVDQLIARITSS